MKSQERIFSRQKFNGIYLENKHGELYICFALWIPLLTPYLYKLVFWKVNYFETEKRAPLTKLLPGDNFLANRGFDISESVKTFVFGSVNPAFTKGTGQ